MRRWCRGPNTNDQGGPSGISPVSRWASTCLAISRRWPEEWGRPKRSYCVDLERYIRYWREKFEQVLPCPVFVVSTRLRTRPLPAFCCRPSPSEWLGKPTALRKPVAHALSRTGDEFDRAAARSDAFVRRARFVTLASPKNQYGWPAWPRARSNIYVLGPAASARRRKVFTIESCRTLLKPY